MKKGYEMGFWDWVLVYILVVLATSAAFLAVLHLNFSYPEATTYDSYGMQPNEQACLNRCYAATNTSEQSHRAYSHCSDACVLGEY